MYFAITILKQLDKIQIKFAVRCELQQGRWPKLTVENIVDDLRVPSVEIEISKVIEGDVLSGVVEIEFFNVHFEALIGA